MRDGRCACATEEWKEEESDPNLARFSLLCHQSQVCLLGRLEFSHELLFQLKQSLAEFILASSFNLGITSIVLSCIRTRSTCITGCISNITTIYIVISVLCLENKVFTLQIDLVALGQISLKVGVNETRLWNPSFGPVNTGQEVAIGRCTG